jgi:hypothetical protein
VELRSLTAPQDDVVALDVAEQSLKRIVVRLGDGNRLAGNRKSGLSPAYRTSFAAIAVSEYRE